MEPDHPQPDGEGGCAWLRPEAVTPTWSCRSKPSASLSPGGRGPQWPAGHRTDRPSGFPFLSQRPALPSPASSQVRQPAPLRHHGGVTLGGEGRPASGALGLMLPSRVETQSESRGLRVSSALQPSLLESRGPWSGVDQKSDMQGTSTCHPVPRSPAHS